MRRPIAHQKAIRHADWVICRAAGIICHRPARSMDFDWNTVWTRGFPLSWVLSHPHSVSRSFLSPRHVLILTSCSFLSLVSSFSSQTWSKTIHLFFGFCVSFCSPFSLSPYISLASPWPLPGGPLCLLKGNRIFRNDPLKSPGWFTDVSVKEQHKVQDCISPHKTRRCPLQWRSVLKRGGKKGALSLADLF